MRKLGGWVVGLDDMEFGVGSIGLFGMCFARLLPMMGRGLVFLCMVWIMYCVLYI